MKKIFSLSFLFLFFFSLRNNAQIAFAYGDHSFQIGGNIIAGYNYRFYQTEITDHHKNNFILDQARFEFRGRVASTLIYKMEFDMADLAADVQTPSTSLNYLKDAYIDYKTPIATIRAGYQKIRYGFNAVVSEVDDPFMQRPSIANKINSRRDIGIQLTHWFPQLGLTLIGGIFSGMGDQFFAVDNKNGKPEYMGRIAYSYPGRNIEEILDVHHSPIPMFQCGVNAKYKEGNTTNTLDYELTTVDGKKTSYGFDASIMFRGISLQVESHQLNIVLNDSTLLFSQGEKYSYFRAGGYLVELNYYFKKIKSAFAVRYDELNPSDLVYGNTQRTIGYGYNYFIRQNFLCIKIQYLQHLKQTYPAGTIWKDDELRAGIQLIF